MWVYLELATGQIRDSGKLGDISDHTKIRIIRKKILIWKINFLSDGFTSTQ